MSLHRQVWSNHFGEIPTDINGVTYEIHHIDGKNKNNLIENLICISLQEHFDIHYKQKDWFACKLIMQKLKIPSEQRAQILKNAGHKISIALTGKKYSNKEFFKRNQNISNALLGKKRPNQSLLMVGKKRPDISKILSGRKRTKETITKLKITLSQQPIRICPYCNKSGKGSNMTRYHFNNCKQI